MESFINFKYIMLAYSSISLVTENFNLRLKKNDIFELTNRI